ncbi:MAG: hypothetical protein IJ714_08840 [Bacteroidales bacterium]|nr:hypothetical protein [Bacteroidales bacterium]
MQCICHVDKRTTVKWRFPVNAARFSCKKADFVATYDKKSALERIAAVNAAKPYCSKRL